MNKDGIEIDGEELDFDVDFTLEEEEDTSSDYADEFSFLTDLKISEEKRNAEADSYLDKFNFLIQDGLASKPDETLGVRELISSRRIDIGAEIDEDISDEELSLDSFEEGFKSLDEEDNLNLDSPIANIPTEELSEYILVKGIYSKAFKEHIKSDKVVPKGDFPLAIEIDGNIILFKMIHPEPKTLYYLKLVLKGFDLIHVKDNIQNELDIYAFLGKTNIRI